MRLCVSIFCYLLCVSSFFLNAQELNWENQKIYTFYPGQIPLFSEGKGYGFDLNTSPDKAGTKPYFFSIQVPDGNYRVTVVLGNKKKPGNTTVRGESRRLFVESVSTKKGEFVTYSFVVNKRNTAISPTESVRIKTREKQKLNWDDKLTLEFNGTAPALSSLSIEQVDDCTTVFLFGNSTVVDQDNEPWASWGQIIPRFFDDKVCFANYAESGESANSFFAAGRSKKALTQMKKGDYLFIEFGHNDQKQKGPGKGAYYSFLTSMKTLVDEAQSKEVQVILVTPTQRRSFDENGKIKDTHLDYPDAVRWMSEKENIPLIDLHKMTRTLYEALGKEDSKKMFVHYPAGTYPGQTKALEDNTHFNPFGAYQIAKCVIEGMKSINLEITKHLRADYQTYSPDKPDDWKQFHWDDCPFTEIEKPDGN